jgi:hypothetical protein
MTERRSTDPSASRDIRNRARGFEEHLCKQPCNVGKALGLYEALDGAVQAAIPPLSPDQASHDAAQWGACEHRGVDLLWRWGHADYKEWLSPPPAPEKAPLTSGSPQTSSRTARAVHRDLGADRGRDGVIRRRLSVRYART